MNQPPDQEPRRARHEHRARSAPFKKPFIEAVLFTAAFYLGLCATFATLFACFILRQTSTAKLLLFFAIASAVLGFFSYLRRRVPRCPLCNGTPLADSDARKHRDAKRLFPLSYGSSNVLRCIVRQEYICPYCGTLFDLLKPVQK